MLLMRRAIEDSAMRLLLKILALYLLASFASRAVIDISQNSGSRPPEPSIVSYSPPPQPMLGSRRAAPELSLQLVEANDINSRNKGLMDLRVKNLSGHGIEVPISLDGKKAFDICGTHPMLTSTISGTSGDKPFSLSLFGCDELKGSTVNLSDGDWISFAGLSRSISPVQSSKQGAFTFSIDENRYSRTDNKVVVARRGLYFIQSNASN